jgi:hypothetical protein
MLPDQQIAVSWLRNSASASPEVCVRLVSMNGKLGPVRVVSQTDHVSAFSVPQLVRKGDDLIVAWTNRVGDSNRVMSARVPIETLSQE